MRIKKVFKVKRANNKKNWVLLLKEENSFAIPKEERVLIDHVVLYGTKKECKAKMAMLKRREYLSSISEVREAQRRELREGAE